MKKLGGLGIPGSADVAKEIGAPAREGEMAATAGLTGAPETDPTTGVKQGDVPWGRAPGCTLQPGKGEINQKDKSATDVDDSEGGQRLLRTGILQAG